jgi:hypothetical protein
LNTTEVWDQGELVPDWKAKVSVQRRGTSLVLDPIWPSYMLNCIKKYLRKHYKAVSKEDIPIMTKMLTIQMQLLMYLY